MRPDDVRASLGALLELREHELACRTLELAFRSLRPADLPALVALLQEVPQELRAGDAAWALLTVQVLGAARRESEVLTFLEVALPQLTEGTAPLLAYRAWAYGRVNDWEAALAEAERALPQLQGETRGLACRTLGEALGWLGRSGWRTAFAQARGLLSGRALGIALFEEGVQLARAGEDGAARNTWREALLHLGADQEYAAWLRYNLGLSCLRTGTPDAEAHFLEMDRLSRQKGGRRFRVRALCGLGAARRALGEWGRALGAYQEAAREARLALYKAGGTSREEELDLRQALRGLGHTLRLSGKAELALVPLLEAARCVTSEEAGQSWVFADIAAAHLALGDAAAAQVSLARTGELSGEDAQRAAIVQAELARRAGNEDGARQLLGGVDARMIWAREELSSFPEVFALLGAARPVPLTRTPGTRVEVFALGALRVLVNNRAVPLRATGRVGELLTLLLEHGGRAPTEVLAETLYPERATDRRKAGRALWALARDLQTILGWAESVRFEGGAYLLDPSAQWSYDVREAQARGEPTPAFLTGVYSNWATERARELEQRTADLLCVRAPPP